VLFFFQAEDGIRGATVTGVQTCALPIYLSSGRSAGPKANAPFSAVLLNDRSGSHSRKSKGSTGKAPAGSRSGGTLVSLPTTSSRSEERRVGKGGRWRGATGGAETRTGRR